MPEVASPVLYDLDIEPEDPAVPAKPPAIMVAVVTAQGVGVVQGEVLRHGGLPNGEGPRLFPPAVETGQVVFLFPLTEMVEVIETEEIALKIDIAGTLELVFIFILQVAFAVFP